MAKPTKPTPPAQALRSEPSTFRTRAEAAITYQWTTFPDYIDAVADFVDEQADAALAAALGGDLPSLTGNGEKFLRVKTDETGAEFMTLGTAAFTASTTYATASHPHSAADINAGTLAAARVPSATIADYRAASDGVFLQPGQVWDSLAEVELTDAANIAWDMSAGINFKVTLGGNRTLDLPSNVKAGQSGTIRVIQDGTGSRTLTLASGLKPAWGVAPVMDTTAAAEDFLTYYAVSSSHINITHARFS